MIAVYLAPVYLLLCAYLSLRGYQWLKVCHERFHSRPAAIILATLFLFLAFSFVIAFFLPASQFRRAMKLIGNYWLGVLLYALITLSIADLLRLLLMRLPFSWKGLLSGDAAFRIVGALCVITVAVISIGGVLNARNIHVTDYDIAIEKDANKLDELNVVLVADLHLGYNIGTSMMEQMVEKINQQEPDLVVIAGDIFDNEYEALDSPERLVEILRTIDSTYGVYACYGNHDVQEDILAGFTFGGSDSKESDPRMDALLEDAGITLLRDEGVLIDDSFYLYGCPDYQKPGRGVTTRKTPAEITADMDLSKPILVMDHQPRLLQEFADAGVDLDLSGHTHDGQMFPGNIVTGLMWENSVGYLQKDSMHSIVTSGVGLFGPNMRVGTKSEICSIHIQFGK